MIRNEPSTEGHNRKPERGRRGNDPQRYAVRGRLSLVLYPARKRRHGRLWPSDLIEADDNELMAFRDNGQEETGKERWQKNRRRLRRKSPLKKPPVRKRPRPKSLNPLPRRKRQFPRIRGQKAMTPQRIPTRTSGQAMSRKQTEPSPGMCIMTTTEAR